MKKTIVSLIRRERFTLTTHAVQRLNERNIDQQEVLQVLQSGYHEKEKDSFDSKGNHTYAVRGRTHDGRELRVIVVLTEDVLLVVTAMSLRGAT